MNSYEMSAFVNDVQQHEKTASTAGHVSIHVAANDTVPGEDVKNGKFNKSTQSDISHSTWKKSRPISLTYLSGRAQPSESSYSTHSSRSTLYPVQSELVLSPRNKYNKYVSLDMRSTNNLSYPSPHSNNQLYGGGAPYTCCCTCTGGSQIPPPPMPPLHQTENHDGPESLSWRRLHMSRAKLKATATTSELLSGFAMVAMVELQINEPTAVPEWLFVMFAVCTTFLVSVHIFALMISTYLLPNVEAISKLQVSRLVTESPHERMRGFIELAWAFSTVLGLFLFLVEVAILCWVKFWDYSFTAATASTVIVIPVLIVFVAFAVHFYHSLVVYKCESAVSDMKDLESIKRHLDSVTIGQTNV
ncbi:calcium release-activated calcium channel protein 1-like [Odontomachus brunneus]|uniref:calcium release-activated calcium channel protein 1-like n=1 Tax=Odontomachus brunneus TaxID=486640 RepID=UPI0013F212C3|nr:calcium release-activated calcium channel protein 1-like [Odontomachus brunneus]XP_032662838.1 calcium release-activated calcium channel protein 1-like [Odontomachus brunneus]